MSSRFPNGLWAIAALIGLSCLPAVGEGKPIRFCADPDNLPYSNARSAGFDNHIAEAIARTMGRKPVFVWARARRGFLREQFNKGACDVLMGVPVGMKGVLSTSPYYRSTYVFVTRTQDHLRVASFSDPRLNRQRIGLQIMEEDLSPPSLPLVRAGHAAQLVGYESFGRESGDIVRAVASKQLGVAVVWGPLAGYFARQQRPALTIVPVSPPMDSGIPFVFDIAFGVHRNDTALRDQLSRAIALQADAIHRILRSYGVPLLSPATGGVQ